MKLQIVLPASALLLAFSAATWLGAPHHASQSPKQIVARAGIGAIRAIVGVDRREATPEVTRSPEPLTLAASRPDSVAPASGSGDIAAIEHYHELAMASARETTPLVLDKSAAGPAVKSFAVAEFERKCAAEAEASPSKPKCTKASLELPIVGCYLQQAASNLVS